MFITFFAVSLECSRVPWNAKNWVRYQFKILLSWKRETFAERCYQSNTEIKNFELICLIFERFSGLYDFIARIKKCSYFDRTPIALLRLFKVAAVPLLSRLFQLWNVSKINICFRISFYVFFKKKITTQNFKKFINTKHISNVVAWS